MIAGALTWLEQVFGVARFDIIEVIGLSLLVWVIARSYNR